VNGGTSEKSGVLRTGNPEDPGIYGGPVYSVSVVKELSAAAESLWVVQKTFLLRAWSQAAAIAFG
jgi:hypothetical protein